MFKITLGSEVLEMNLSMFMGFINNTIIGAYTAGEGMFFSGLIGFPDTILDAFMSYLKESLKLLEELETQTKDEILRLNIRDISLCYRSLIEKDQDLANIVAEFSGMSLDELLRSDQFGSLQEFDEDNLPTGNSSLPEWYYDQNYQRFLEEIKEIMKSIININEQIFQRLEYIRVKSDVQYDNQMERDIQKKFSDIRVILQDGL